MYRRKCHGRFELPQLPTVGHLLSICVIFPWQATVGIAKSVISAQSSVLYQESSPHMAQLTLAGKVRFNMERINRNVTHTVTADGMDHTKLAWAGNRYRYTAVISLTTAIILAYSLCRHPTRTSSAPSRLAPGHPHLPTLPPSF